MSAEERPHAGSGPVPAELPLCVDLDGTLVATDTLVESFVRGLATRPLSMLALPLRLLRGRAATKAWLAALAPPDAATLPYRAEVLDYLREARAEGRRVVLATASDRAIAEAVAAELGLFTEVLASAEGHNLKGARKRETLEGMFGSRGFEYLGDSAADLAVWDGAARASTVGLGPRAQARVAARAPLGRHFAVPPSTPRTWLRALRVHQWVKNLLVFLPMIMAHEVADPGLWGRSALAFLALSLCASAVYVGNDLADLAADRGHPTKRRRPFAAGRLPLWAGLAAVPLLLGAGLGLALAALPAVFAACLGAYVALSATYTFVLKRVAVVDVVVLAGLYCLRVLAGGLAVAIDVSPWLMGFCLFFFLSLAFLKRYAELRLLAEQGSPRAGGRDYEVGDAPLLLAVGTGSGLLAALVLALYVQSERVVVLYAEPALLWFLVPLLVFWTTRIWLLAQRGRIVDDPVLATARDPVSYAVAAAAALILAAATLLQLGA
jgi:4-hydroxybenzoate polyprenyltransferase/phosphoserine phosphatase